MRNSEEIKPQEESKRLAEMSEVPKLEAEMASEQSRGKPYGEKSKDPEIPDGEIRAAGKPELSEHQPEELQPQDSLKRWTMEPEITGESELMSEMSSEIRIQTVERTTRLPAELPSTLNVERRGAGASQITAEAAKEAEDRKQPTVSEEKEVEQEETLVDETPASSRLAEVQDRRK